MSIRYTERLAEAGIDPSVGSKGDSYDNALAETINGLPKAELIHSGRPGKPGSGWIWRPWNGCSGSTTTDCSSPSATSLRLKLKQTTTGNSLVRSKRRPDLISTEGREIQVNEGFNGNSTN